MILGCVFVLFTVLLISQINRFEPSSRAVVTSEQAKIVYEPSEDAMDTGLTLVEGQAVRVLETEGSYYKIKRPDGQSGWVKAQNLELL